MQFKHKIIPAIFPLFKIRNSIFEMINLSQNQRLRAMIFHDISPRNLSKFSNQITHLIRSWEFITTEQFVRILSGSEEIKKKVFF